MAGSTDCLPLEEVSLDDIGRVGGKTASLGEMIRNLSGLGVRIPPGFAITADAYRKVLAQGETTARLRAALESLDVTDLDALAEAGHRARSIIVQAGLPSDVASSIREAYARLCDRTRAEVRVAVRSSATAEDLPQASFAGQQATFLNVGGVDDLLRATIRCFASLFTDRAIAYRHAHGFDHFSVLGAVAVQQMVRADVGSAGVIFTLDPETGFRDVVLITGAWGLGENVVAGRVDPDEVLVFKPTLGRVRQPIVRHEIGRKETRIVYAARGESSTRVLPVSAADRARMSFSDEDAEILAKWAVIIEEHYSARASRPVPMDIEWAKDGVTGELYVVQARPETVHAIRGSDALIRYDISTRGHEPVLRGVAIGQNVGAGPARLVGGMQDLHRVQPGDIIVADMTDPDWVPAMRKAAGIITNRGGRTCHAAIVSRELGVPCIVGTGTATERLRDDQLATVSCAHGSEGRVYEGRLSFERIQVPLAEIPRPKTKIMLILADPDQAFVHSSLPVAGVGLVRQEFVTANHVGLHPLAALHPERLEEDERRRVEAMVAPFEDPVEYWVTKTAEGLATIAAAFHPRDVIVRLGDFKSNEYARLVGGRSFEPREENPMIGLRGASRYVHEEFAPAFALECRALRRVREEMGLSNVALMVPFCRTAQEGRKVLDALAEHGLKQGEGGLKVWVMCEIPSNVVAIDTFAEVFDGFSIGSNDLTQLVLGVDRDSAELAHLFSERDVAVMRMIRSAIEGAHRYGRPIGLCGQAPSDDPEFAAFLVQAGIDSISLNPDAVLSALRIVAKAERELAR